MKAYSLIISLFFATCLWAQTPLMEQVEFEHGCNYIDDDVNGLLTLQIPSNKAKEIIQEILEKSGHTQNFELRVANEIANARAAESGGRKFILYNSSFMDNFQTKSLTYWAAYSLLAHEVGHHALEHDLTTQDPRIRKDQELKADAFSAEVMEQLGATVDEVLAGIRTFEGRSFSATHPDPEDREEAIRQAYLAQAGDRWRNQQGEDEESTAPGSKKTRITLDEKAYTRNRWNLLNSAEAEIDNEKISIRYRLEDLYPGRNLKICLLSNDPLIGPEVRTIGSLSGTGDGIKADREGLVVWNYRLDRYTPNEVSKPDMLRILVYDSYDLPTAPAGGAWLGSVGTTAIGLGSVIYGLLEIKKGNDIYEIYKDERDPLALVYADESRSDRYERADKHYSRGHVFLFAGTAATLAGGAWLFNKIRQNQSYKKDGQCSLDTNWSISPELTADFSGVQLGLSMYF